MCVCVCVTLEESSLCLLEVRQDSRNDESSTILLLVLEPGTGLSALVDLALSATRGLSPLSVPPEVVKTGQHGS